MPSLASSRLSAFILVVVCIVFAAPAWAQKDTGSIVGTVKDQTGAVVAGAKVTVTDVERGITFDTTTNQSGDYVASNLRVGRYTVTVEHPGFKKAVSVPVSLDVQQRIPVNVTLEVGAITEAVEVTGVGKLDWIREDLKRIKGEVEEKGKKPEKTGKTEKPVKPVRK